MMEAMISLSAKTMTIRVTPRKQSGVVPFKITNKLNVKFLLIQKTGSGKWGFPKGKVENNLTKKNSALVEAYEEGGVSGNILGNIGRYKYVKNKTRRIQTVDLFLMEVTKVHNNYLETDRKRKWFSYKDALKALPKDQMPFLTIAATQIEKEQGIDI